MAEHPMHRLALLACLLLGATLSALGQEAGHEAGQEAPLPPGVDSSALRESPSQQPPALSTPLPARLSDVEGPVRITQLPAGPQASTQGDRSSAPPPMALPDVASPDAIPPPPPDAGAPGAAAPAAAPQAALLNMPVLAGTQLETGENGRAEIQFNDGTLVRLTPNSAVLLLSLSAAGEEVRALSGLTYYQTPGSVQFILQVGPDAARVAGSTLIRADLDHSPFQLAVLRGSAHLNNAAADVGFDVLAGETGTIDPASANSYDLHQDLAANTWDAWNADRDKELAERAAGVTDARISSGDANNPGWNDLDYYGTWYNVPGVGQAWAPDGVDASFDPYGQGAWGVYPGVGPVWISAYPWGWLPYHCGGWGFYPQFGWLWQPGGGCGYGGIRWYPYGGIYHAPPGYHLPLRPVRPVRPIRPIRPIRPGGGAAAPAIFLSAVNRGPVLPFRQSGGNRPLPRAFPLESGAAGSPEPTAFAPTLPLMSRSTLYGSAYGSSFMGGRGLYSSSPLPLGGNGRSIYTQGSGAVAQRGRGLAPAPRVLAPPPRAISPPPAARPAAPSVAAPRGH